MIKKKGILQSMIIKEPLEIDYENESVDSILKKIQMAIEQDTSFLKVVSREEIEAQQKLDVTRQWDY
jgi:BMFP domain-containing protein YqiC